VRPGRLRLTAFLVVLVVVFVAGGLFLALQIVRSGPAMDGGVMAKHIAEDLAEMRGDPARLAGELDELRRSRFEVSIYRPDGGLLASTIDPPLALATPAEDDNRWNAMRVVERAGQPVATVRLHLPGPRLHRSLAPLAVLFGVLLVLVIVIVRYIGGPMQQIADAARRFGRGDLNARARVDRNDELGQVGRVFDEMADRVTTLMTAQRELMANVSHELQTPLARIQVAVDLMVDGIDDRAKELLPEISRDLGDVERLIDDVMTLSRFDLAHTQGTTVGAPLRPEASAIGELIDRAASRFRAQHPGRALEVDTAAALPVLWLDAVLVRRVIENLLDNARKYSEADTTIRISAVASAGGVTVAVRDRGIGIDETDLAQLFTPFFRTDRSRTRATGGVGLGLVLARRVVEAHGGTISVHSEVRSGTTVIVELPGTAPDGPDDTADGLP
jgi:signal transduction histidine kinase